MRRKLIFHYLCSFIGACLFIFIINIGFMVFNIYILNDKEDIFNYYPTELMEKIYENIDIVHNKVKIDGEGIKLLNESEAGLQILNGENREVFNYNMPKEAPFKYSNKDIIDMYKKNDNTLFLGEKELNGEEYSYLLFLKSGRIKRISLSYDSREITKIHRFPLLIVMNILVVLIISFLYTLKLTKPINNIIEKIFDLSKGVYINKKISTGIYFKVEKGLNELGERLDDNEKERAKLDEMREEWISNISHDIKTPLTSIIGNAEIIGDIEYELRDEGRVKSSNTIINKSHYIKNLVEELNLSARLKSNSLNLNKKKVNIVSLVRHVVIDIINDENINIEFNYSEKEIFLDIDENLINRVFINILMNSIIHNDKNVNINVNIFTDNSTNNRVNIFICDNGKGMNREEVNHIFERYYRGTNTKNKIEGSGLGMAIAHDIIKAHNGEIKVISELDKGMKVEVNFENEN
ncbi:HAMP domain-containing sensor histidine kinase [uncultured Clostridium sp.]|uniref:sensor histidine kinase n=1 Tax=uncultured Clostridium sp. TaxID=59620 RepID=UPI0026235C7B|nr:HAMP domain-containing sensor histidine kinase [uncultured Clostridium sp.]